MKTDRGFSVIEGLFIIIALVITAGVGIYVFHKHDDKNIGSSSCVSWVRKIEGSNKYDNYSLYCSFSPEKIANSSLAAQFLQFSGAPKGVTGCLNSASNSSSYSTDCIEFAGTVLSDGSYFEGIGGDNTVQVPQD